MRKLLIIDNDINQDTLDLLTRLDIPEVTTSIPPRYRDVVSTLPCIIVEDGEDVLSVIPVGRMADFTYNFDTIRVPIRPPAPSSLVTRLEELENKIQLVRADIDILKGGP